MNNHQMELPPTTYALEMAHEILLFIKIVIPANVLNISLKNIIAIM